MDIQILEGTQGAQQAKDIAVVIDVLRAATVSAYLLDAGVTAIIPVATYEEAFAHKENDQTTVLVGEYDGVRIPGFDIGNSPSEIKQRGDLHGKQAVHRSSTGTQGIVSATNAQQVIFGSFVTAGAILEHLRKHSDRSITLVPMYALEDQLFAEYLRDTLLGNTPVPLAAIKKQLSERKWVQESFLNPENDAFPESDFHLSLELDVFDFFPVVHEGKIIKSTQLRT